MDRAFLTVGRVYLTVGTFLDFKPLVAISTNQCATLYKSKVMTSIGHVAEDLPHLPLRDLVVITLATVCKVLLTPRQGRSWGVGGGGWGGILGCP